MRLATLAPLASASVLFLLGAYFPMPLAADEVWPGALNWTVEGMRTVPSIKRERMSRSLLVGSIVEEFEPEGENITLVTIRSQTKSRGSLPLVPEMFMVQSDYLYKPCIGIRRCDAETKGGFSIPSGGTNVWSTVYSVGDTIVLELAFVGTVRRGDQLLASRPIGTPTRRAKRE